MKFIVGLSSIGLISISSVSPCLAANQSISRSNDPSLQGQSLPSGAKTIQVAGIFDIVDKVLDTVDSERQRAEERAERKRAEQERLKRQAEAEIAEQKRIAENQRQQLPNSTPPSVPEKFTPPAPQPAALPGQNSSKNKIDTKDFSIVITTFCWGKDSGVYPTSETKRTTATFQWSDDEYYTAENYFKQLLKALPDLNRKPYICPNNDKLLASIGFMGIGQELKRLYNKSLFPPAFRLDQKDFTSNGKNVVFMLPIVPDDVATLARIFYIYPFLEKYNGW